MNTEEIFATLDDYLDGKLSTQERSELETRLAGDSTLTEQLEMLRELRSMVAAEEGEQRLREKLKTAAAPYFEEEKTTAKRALLPLWRKLAIAASVLLFCLAGWYLFSTRHSGEEKWVAKYLVPPADLGLSRSASTEAARSLENQVDSLYRLRQYRPALALMQQVEGTFSEQPSSAFYFHKGILLLFDGQPEKALAAFDKVQNGYQNDKKWYSAWAHYKGGNTLVAKAIFQEIAQSDSPYRGVAEEVLEKM